jgi:ABC-type cobalamin/Fe3+-siderophores transport system ATPase subunit
MSRDSVRLLRRTVEDLADGLQTAVLVAEQLAQTASLTARDALTLTLRLRRATRVLRRLRPTKGGAS